MAYHRFDGVVKNSICPMQIRAFTAVRQSRLTRSPYLSPAPIYGQIVEFPMDVFGVIALVMERCSGSGQLYSL
jgi:hypothetical protein